MAGNNDPIFSRIGDVSNNGTTGMNQPVLLAANDFTGAGANNSLVFTADATNGSFVQRLRFKAAGVNIASLMRIFLNNGSTNGTAANNSLYAEIQMPATFASATQPNPDIDYPINFALPAGFRIYVGLATAVAAGWVCVPIAGKY